MALTSRWRTQLDDLRTRLRNRAGANAVLWTDDQLRGQVYNAEDVVTAPGVPVTVTAEMQAAFDTAVRELVDFWLANPDAAVSTTDSLVSRKYADEVPVSVRNFWANYATGSVAGSDEKNLIVGQWVDE